MRICRINLQRFLFHFHNWWHCIWPWTYTINLYWFLDVVWCRLSVMSKKMQMNLYMVLWLMYM